MYHYECEECGRPFTANRRNRQYCSRACQHRANNSRAQERLEAKPLTTAWSCGGGVQSTAIAALIVTGDLPKPDLAYMTDCGWEKEATWDYVHSETIPRLRSVGVELHIIRSVEWGANTDLVDGAGHVVIPAYQERDGRVVKFRTHCNAAWKTKVARRWLRAQGVQRCENWVGFSTDEAGRARSSVYQWCSNRYPLLERGMSREACLHYLGSHGWPMPPRTSCVICPQQTDASWAELRACHPRDWERAVDAEKAIQRVQPDVFLHRSLVPLSEMEW